MGIIRLLLAISVIIAHSESIFGIKMVGGTLAVQAFFIISGFYMALILSEKYTTAAQNRGGYKLFITNRLAKLYPSYWIVCLLILALSAAAYLYSSSPFLLSDYARAYHYLSPLTLGILIFSNASLLLQDVLMFMGLSPESGLLYFAKDLPSTPLSEVVYPFLLVRPAWSISIEIMFYLIAPYLVKRSNRVITLLIGLSLLTRLALYLNGYFEDPWSYRFFPSELLFFLLGIVGYRIYRWLAPWFGSAPERQRILWTVYLGCIILILSLPLLPIPQAVRHILFLVYFFPSVPLIFILSKHWKRDRYLGELSYPLYISHLFCLVFAERALPRLGLSADWSGELCLLLTLLFSILLNEFVLKPIDKHRQGRVLTPPSLEG